MRGFRAVRAALAALLLTGLAVGLGACGDEEPAEAEAPRDEISEAQREKRAAFLHRQMRVAQFPERIRGLTEVAHLYWDTEVGPKAWFDLVYYLLDSAMDDPERALQELKKFDSRCPESVDLMTAAAAFCNATKKALLERENDDKRQLRERLLPEGIAVWMEIADRLGEHPDFASDFGFQLECGNAYLFGEELAKAEAAWARVESFEKPASASQRYSMLIRRADLMRSHLDDPARSLELFKQAQALEPDIDPNPKDPRFDYVEKAVAELEG